MNTVERQTLITQFKIDTYHTRQLSHTRITQDSPITQESHKTIQSHKTVQSHKNHTRITQDRHLSHKTVECICLCVPLSLHICLARDTRII